jgi:uncharacterized protein (DUF1684 family)
MTRRFAGLSVGVLASLVAICVLMQPPQAAAQTTPTASGPSTALPTLAASPADRKWLNELADWRAARERLVDAPDGWLSLVGMTWLNPGANSVGAAEDNQIRIHDKVPDHIGVLTVGSNVLLQAPKGGFPPGLMVDGKPATEGPLAVDGDSPPVITWHGLTIVALSRGGRYLLSIKDADSPLRTGFHGLNWYPPDPRFRVTAAWTPYNPPRMVKIPTVLGNTLDFPSPGFAEFVLDGQPINLEPVTEPGHEDTLFFILTDVTSQITTYKTARYLHTGPPDHGFAQPGQLTLDFNKLENPPCAYTTYASCPLPPDQNQLPVAIEAGERLYTPR